MKVAVTGAAGYLGKVLLPFLEKSDSIGSIVAIDVVEPPKTKKMTFSKRDVRDPGIFHDLEGCDAVVHLAFIVMPIHGEKEMDSINIEGSRNVFTQAAAVGIKKIVHLSSVASYGSWADNPNPLYEHSPLRPMKQFYYSRTKGAVEAFLDTFEPAHKDIVVTRLRPCIFVGPKINNLMTDLMKAQKAPTFKGYKSLMQFVWDEDVVQGIMLALEKDARGAFNLAGDNPITMEEMARIAGAQVVEIPYAVAYWSTKILWALHLHKMSHAGWIEVSRYPIVVNCDKAKQELGWKPSLDSSGAIERFVSEYRAQNGLTA